jgi:hypothetical protein
VTILFRKCGGRKFGLYGIRALDRHRRTMPENIYGNLCKVIMSIQGHNMA